jgi:hypothetical protein
MLTSITDKARAAPTRPKSEKPRKSREGKRSKRLKRQQPERKEKYRERQCRANRTQHHKLSNPSVRHDMQRNALTSRLSLTDTAFLPAGSNGVSGG